MNLLSLIINGVLLGLICVSIEAKPSPMLYKRNPDEKYEADLVAVSSTVIPLTVLEVSYGVGGKPSEAYKAAYLRKLRKQVLQRAHNNNNQQDEDDQTVPIVVSVPAPDSAPSDADALITVKSQHTKAEVKAV
ncbi:uncharacterized protein LOC6652798 [Drosophila willistoni]|nr:uncharacterized protein LOC6652798 [Drosophila willistoni]